jgi:cytochrome c553
VNRICDKVALVMIGVGVLLACSSARAAPPAEAAICSSCHGANGMGNAGAGFPALAGLPASYLAAQMMGFQKGTRVNPMMSGVVANLTIAQINSIVAYYAALPLPQTPEPTPLPAGSGAVLAIDGDWNHSTAGIPACDSCHGPYGLGVGSAVPRLAGQPSTYIVAQLGAWQKDGRKGDPQGLMKRVADKLTAVQINAVANYYAALSPNPPALPKPGGTELGK